MVIVMGAKFDEVSASVEEVCSNVELTSWLVLALIVSGATLLITPCVLPSALLVLEADCVSCVELLVSKTDVLKFVDDRLLVSAVVFVEFI